MNPADIDPSLCTGERTLDSLDDGFSPPAPLPEADAPEESAPADDECVLGSKSPF